MEWLRDALLSSEGLQEQNVFTEHGFNPYQPIGLSVFSQAITPLSIAPAAFLAGDAMH
jgi:hypothetical protein